jgi:hypothetical protein
VRGDAAAISTLIRLRRQGKRAGKARVLVGMVSTYNTGYADDKLEPRMPGARSNVLCRPWTICRCCEWDRFGSRHGVLQ